MSTRTHLVALGFAVFVCSPCTLAQESLVGTYKGSIEIVNPNRKFNAPLTLEIVSAENGKLIGKWQQGPSGCQGEYPVSGTYEGAKVEIKLGEGSIRGCGNNTFSATAQGGKLVGKWGRVDIELSK